MRTQTSVTGRQKRVKHSVKKFSACPNVTKTVSFGLFSLKRYSITLNLPFLHIGTLSASCWKVGWGMREYMLKFQSSGIFNPNCRYM